MRRILALLIVLLAPGAICFAQGGIGHTCDPTGTWFGPGGDPPVYRLTIRPEAAGRYSVEYQIMPDPGAHYTSFTGELIKSGAKTYTQYTSATFTENQAAVDFYASLGITVDVTQWEADATYGHAVMLDCNTIQSTIEWYGWYVPLTAAKVPFVTQPEVEYIRDALGGEPIIETYHRVSGAYCPVCISGGSAAGNTAGGKKHLMPKWHRR